MELTNFCKNGRCSNCGECCSDTLHLSNEEIKRIDDYLKEHKITPAPYRTIDNGNETDAILEAIEKENNLKS